MVVATAQTNRSIVINLEMHCELQLSDDLLMFKGHEALPLNAAR